MAELIYKQTDINGENFTLEPVGELIRCGECKWYFENEDYETLDAIPFCDHPEGGGVTSGRGWYCADGERTNEVEHDD